ncbi:MAG TPA: hypothetical protein PK303_02305 [bacterium]|nr:hypothetical protein [bacterium]HOL34374.1 hypothetical protein [bacterium]HPP07939.1 hypothetical protein [bacterium]
MRRQRYLTLLLLLISFSLFASQQPVASQHLVYLLGNKTALHQFNLFTGLLGESSFGLQAHTLTIDRDLDESSQPSTLAFDPENKRLYVTFTNSDTIFVYDAGAFVQKAGLQIPGASNFARIAVPQDNSDSKIYAVERDGTHLFVFDRRTLERLTAMEFELISPTQSIWVYQGRVFAADTDGIRIYEEKVPVFLFPVAGSIKSISGHGSSLEDITLFGLMGPLPPLPDDISGIWQMETFQVSGTITAGENGMIVPGDFWMWTDGRTETVMDGTYDMNSDGSIVFQGTTTGGTFHFNGIMRQKGDIVCFQDVPAVEAPDRGLGFLIKTGNNYSLNDFSGQWNVKGTKLSGYIQADGNGNITGSRLTLPDGTSETITGGTYTIDPETKAITLHVLAGENSYSFVGCLNKAGDIAILRNEQPLLARQLEITESELVILVKSINRTFENKDIFGCWQVMAMHFKGTIVVDTSGNITGGTVIKDRGIIRNISGGNFIFKPDGELLVNFSAGDDTFSLQGVMSPYKDFIAFVNTATGPEIIDRNLGTLTKYQPTIVVPNDGSPVVGNSLFRIKISTNTLTEVPLGVEATAINAFAPLQRVFVTCKKLNEIDQCLRLYDENSLEETLEINIPFETWGPIFDCAVREITGSLIITNTCTSHPDGNVKLGDNVTFSITISNTSDITISKIPLRNLFNPACLSFLTASVQPDEIGSGQLDWSDITGEGDLGSGESINIEITFNAISNADPVLNRALMHDATDAGGNPVPDVDADCPIKITGTGSLTVVKSCISHPDGKIPFGNNAVFQVRITNNSVFPVVKLPFRDTFDPNIMAFVSASISPDHQKLGEACWDNLLDETLLQPSDSLSFTIILQALEPTSFTTNTCQVSDASDLYGNPIPASVSEISLSILPFAVEVQGGDTVSSYVMVSFPLLAKNPDPGINLLASLGFYDPAQWRLFRWNPDANPASYEEYKEGNPLFDIQPGKAYWLISRNTVKIRVTGTPITTSENYLITLRPGWNQIACPFNFSVPWAAAQVRNGETNYSAAERHTLWKYANGKYIEADALEPGSGYWVWNPTEHELEISIPPQTVGAPILVPSKGVIKNEPQPPQPPGQTLVESSKGSSGGGCFIATACFGPSSPEVKILRKFRDRFLLNHWIGRKFVAFYYKFSPPFADFLHVHPFFRNTVRATLVPVVRLCQKLIS